MFDLTLFYKIQNNLVDFKFPKEMSLNTSRCRKSHMLTYNLFPTRIDAFKHSFFPRTIPIWNSLPADVATSHSLASFKERLSNHLFVTK